MTLERRVIRLTTAAGLLLLPISICACGFIFSHGPPDGHERMDYFSCTESNAGPIIDAIWGGLNVLGALVIAGDPAAYDNPDATIASGLVWDDVKAQLANKAFVMDQPVGAGHIIAFAEDPNFRAFTEGTELLFINAVVLGPAH